MTFFFAALLLAVVVHTLATRRDLLSPGRVYLFVYCLLLAIYSLKLSRYQIPWSSTTHMVFWGGSALFLCGCLLMTLLARITNPQQAVSFEMIKSAVREDAARIDWQWFLWVWLFCALFFLAVYCSAALKTGMVPALAVDPSRARMAFIGANRVIAFTWFFGPISLMLAVELLLFSNFSRPAKTAIALASLLVLAVYLTLLMRMDLYRLIILAAVLIHYGKRRLSVRMLAAMCVVAVVVFMGAMFVRMDYQGFQLLTDYIQVKMPRKYLWASSIYAYVVNNFWNLDYALRRYVDGQQHYPTSFGFELFRVVMFAFRMIRPLEDAYGFDSPFNESVAMIAGLNTVVYLWHFYKDFGPAGAYLLALVFGMGASLYYQNCMVRATLLRLTILSLVIGCIAMSFMIPLWSFWTVYLNAFVLFVAHRHAAQGAAAP
jgi:oligosaccharide repeat unit polymerase